MLSFPLEKMNPRQYLFFKLQRAIGSHVEQCYAELKSFERSSISDIREFQRRSLTQLLSHAATNVPFYQERVPASKSLGLADFPILTKADITQNFDRLMTKRLREEYAGKVHKSLYSWVPVQTGGSTGIPTTVIHDASYRDKGRAARVYAQELCGFSVGTPYFRLWGSMRDINQMKDSVIHRFASWLQSEVVLNAFRMSEDEMAGYVDCINSHSANHMMCYVDAGYQLALFIKKRNLKVKPLKSIMACAGTLTDDVRHTLEEVFCARIHNQYGSRDCAGIACECEAGSIHTYGTNVIVEAVDDRGAPVELGKTGRLLISLLGNFAFPIIRYDIGDMGATDNIDCDCGRVFPCLKRIEGRNVEFLVAADGSYVTPVYVRHLIGVVHNRGLVQRFQLVQHTKSDFELRVVSNCSAESHQFHDFVQNVDRDLRFVLGKDARVHFIRENELQASPSGKFLYTLNMMRASQS